MRSQRYKKILQENRKFERESPYNFCDRWCERCIHEKQIRCRLYLDDLERRATCIAHGKDEDDLEITKKVMEAQYGDIEEKLQDTAKKFNIDLDNIDIDEEDLDEEQRIDLEDLPKEIQEHIKFVENHPLPRTVDQYRGRAHAFLKDTFYEKDEKENIPKDIKYHFETVSWYHWLLSAKLQRALAGFYEPVCEDEFGLYDAVAQFAICRKGIIESVKALRKIKLYCPDKQKQIIELLALLNNIHSRIKAIEESI